MLEPVFSIIIVTYKRFSFFKKALESVVGQSFSNFECLIFNDFPGDNDKLSNYIKSLGDPRLIFHPSDQQSGGNHWRNRGISLSKANIVAFLDDDDLWEKNKLDYHLLCHKKAGELSLVFSDYYKFFPEIGFIERGANTALRGDVIEEMRTGRFSISTTSSVSIEGLGNVPIFDETLPSFQDWDAWFNLKSMCPEIKFLHIPEPLVYFTQHQGDRVSQNNGKREFALNLLKEKYKGKSIAGFVDKELLNLRLLSIAEGGGTIFLQLLQVINILIKNPRFLKKVYTYKRIRRHFVSK